ncbi:MAG: hypothetical protein FJ095_17235 [Deltaproteobacteria bacterium]|nr:hypothetical protein [Deltaproteobacteria bacterium]
MTADVLPDLAATSEPASEARSLVPVGWAVPARIRLRIGAQAGRQRAVIEDGHLILVLHAPPRDDEIARPARLFWRAPEGAWRASGAGLRDDDDGLAALHEHLGTLERAIVALDDRVDTASSARQFFEVLHAATPLQRTTRNLHRALQEARAAIEDRRVLALRDEASDLERAAELLVDDARNGLDYATARAAEEQAQRAEEAAVAQHRLNLLAAVFFPVTAIGSILGINMRSGLEGAHPGYFWLVLTVALGIGFVIRGAIARRQG